MINKKALFITPNYKGRYNIGNHHFKEQFAKLFNESVFYGEGYKGYNEKFDLNSLIKIYNPDVLIFRGCQLVFIN